VDALQRGQSRTQVAFAFLSSPEAYQLALTFYYTDFLGRAPDPAGIQNFFAALQNAQFTPAGISTVFLASDEFFQRALRFAGG